MTQPDPIPNDSPSIHDLVISEVESDRLKQLMSDRIAELEQENRQQKAEIDALTKQLHDSANSPEMQMIRKAAALLNQQSTPDDPLQGMKYRG